METSNPLEEAENNIEQFKEVELAVHYPDKMGLHTWGIEFDDENKKVCKAYGSAIMEICKDLGCFHQSGTYQGMGYQFFEIFRLNDGNAEKAIRELIPQVHTLAKKKYESGFIMID